MILYHGTTDISWRRKKPGKSTLYLVNSFKDAVSYAEEQSERDEGKPIVLKVELNKIKSLVELEPDWGWSVDREVDWKESLETVGSIAVSGNIDSIKKFFKEILLTDKWGLPIV